jgi:cysteinyl-tRNA synthetase
MLRVFDSKQQALVVFTPVDFVRPKDDKSVEKPHIGMYVCGPTVQSSPHIGHMRSAVAFDVIRRYLMVSGYKVKYVQNVTDIDDKILNKSREAGVNWREHAKKYEQEFVDAYRALGVMKPDANPHATKYIGQQIELIKRLVERGYAYQGEGADVWFDTATWKDYGELTRQCNADDLEVDAADDRPGKQHPRDFALWKTPKDTDPEDASWGSPWGKGRPGWHLECSAMAGDLLGSSFEIHGGGLDLRFPHHENELAQSRAAGDDFAKYWLHSAWVTQKGVKMSKSLGNGLSVEEVIGGDPVNALALRYALAAVNYRNMLEWDISGKTMKSARATVERLQRYLSGAIQSEQNVILNPFQDLSSTSLPQAFRDCMDNDVDVSGALAVVFELV